MTALACHDLNDSFSSASYSSELNSLIASVKVVSNRCDHALKHRSNFLLSVSMQINIMRVDSHRFLNELDSGRF